MITPILKRAQNSIILLLLSSGLFTGFMLGASHADAAMEFDFSAQYSVGQRPFAIAMEDFDSDGDIDIATVNDANHTISVLLNNGNGIFSAESTIDVALEFPHSIKSGDLDNDGDADLVVSSGTLDHKVVVLLNNGNAVFETDSVLLAEGVPHTITIADFNNDGNLDIATSNSYRFVFTVFLNDGSGKFIASSKPTVGHTSHGITSADFDNDGDADLALAQAEDNNVVMFINNGSGTFTRGATVPVPLPFRIESSDFDSDGDIDISTVNNQNHTVSILLNNGNSTFIPNNVVVGNYPNSITIEDVDNDGDIDIIVAGGTNKDLSILLNNGFGVFSIEKNVSINEYLNAIAAADFDDDGDIDLATTFGVSDFYVAILLQAGSPNTAPILNLIGNQNIPENQNLSFSLSANDPDSDSLIYSVSGLPSGAILNANTGEFMWTPGYNNSGVYPVTFVVSDGTLSDSESIEITVSNSNRAPALDIIGNQVISENQNLSFILNATDPDGDILTYGASNLPNGATFNLVTRTFSWTPGYTASGNYENVEFTVNDNGSPMELDVERITITVGDANRAPVFISPGAQEVLENQQLSFVLSASDPDIDTVTLSASGLPAGAIFNILTGLFTWTPTVSQEGVYVVTFIATDNGIPAESSVINVVITVGDNPTPIEQAKDIVDRVANLDLPINVENSYMANLQKVASFIEEGTIQATVNQLNAFINKVSQDYNQNKITIQVRNSLVAMAQGLIGDLVGN
jgi:hypothetical protein